MRNRLAMALAAATLLGFGMAAAQTPAAAPTKIDQGYLPYAKPQLMLEVQPGRKIQILCMGQGSPTVILTAGLGNWSETWRRVQPAVSRKTRVCAWDRAGYGFSSPSAEPQDVAHTTADLEAALKAADIRGPYVLVGHSLGGYESLLFADRHPKAVVGMVLDDPSVPDQRKIMADISEEGAKLQDTFMGAGIAQLRACAAKARKAPLTPAEAPGCIEIPPDVPPEFVASLRPLYDDPARFETQASLAEQFGTDSTLVINPHRNYGAMPIIVLTAGQMQAFPPEAHIPKAAVDAMSKFMTVAWPHAHDQLAALSTRGQNRIVPDSSHYIQLLKPQLVIDAIDQVVDEARAK